MDSLFDQNRRFLQSRFPSALEAYQKAVPPPASGPDWIELPLPLPGAPKLRLSAGHDAFVEEHQRTLAGAAKFAGAMVWGVRTADDLEFYWHSLPRRPFVYLESDPAVFARVLQKVRLDRLFGESGARIAFASDCGELMSEMAVAFGEEELTASRIGFLFEPSLFSRLLAEDHPMGRFVNLILKNVFLNRSEEEMMQAKEGLKEKQFIDKIFPPAYLYQSMQRFLNLLAVASPGIRTLYREMTRPVDARAVLPVSIVILAWNRWDLTERCLRALCSHPLPADSEIIVVDNGSAGRPPEMLKALAERLPPLRPLTLPRNLGPAGGRDEAAKIARGKTLVFLDNDVEIKHERWLDILLEPFLFYPRVGSCGAFGVIHTHDESETWSQKIVFPGLVVPVSWISSFCLAVRKQALIECGGWRPDLYPLYGMEDVALGYALREAGWISVVPGQFVPVTHGMNHKDGHYDYDFVDSGKRNSEIFSKIWGPRRRLLNAARGNRTLATIVSSPAA